jgi:hypothetical protein
MKESDIVLIDYIEVLEDAIADIHNFADWRDLQGHCGKSNKRCQDIFNLFELIKAKK